MALEINDEFREIAVVGGSNGPDVIKVRFPLPPLIFLMFKPPSKMMLPPIHFKERYCLTSFPGAMDGMRYVFEGYE
jgi:hypothetical protein